MEKLPVLVVDDDREIVESIAIFLQADGYLVRKAYNGLEALDIVMTENVHLIILDIMMPELDGIKTLLKVRESKNLPIILLSAKSEDNDKILGLPDDFAGTFMVEESYYEVDGKKSASPHLFLFTEEKDGVLLTSYDTPEGNDKRTFSYATMVPAEFSSLRESGKFTPALYREHDGVWEGGSDSMFSPVMRFHLFERFSADVLEVSESMEMNGKRVFGFDEPILYKRIGK